MIARRVGVDGARQEALKRRPPAQRRDSRQRRRTRRQHQGPRTHPRARRRGRRGGHLRGLGVGRRPLHRGLRRRTRRRTRGRGVRHRVEGLLTQQRLSQHAVDLQVDAAVSPVAPATHLRGPQRVGQHPRKQPRGVVFAQAHPRRAVPGYVHVAARERVAVHPRDHRVGIGRGHGTRARHPRDGIARHGNASIGRGACVGAPKARRATAARTEGGRAPEGTREDEGEAPGVRRGRHDARGCSVSGYGVSRRSGSSASRVCSAWVTPSRPSSKRRDRRMSGDSFHGERLGAHSSSIRGASRGASSRR